MYLGRWGQASRLLSWSEGVGVGGTFVCVQLSPSTAGIVPSHATWILSFSLSEQIMHSVCRLLQQSQYPASSHTLQVSFQKIFNPCFDPLCTGCSEQRVMLTCFTSKCAGFELASNILWEPNGAKLEIHVAKPETLTSKTIKGMRFVICHV